MMKHLDWLLLLVRIFPNYLPWLAWAVWCVAFVLAVGFDQLLRAQTARRDTGPLWAGVVLVLTWVWVVLLPLSYAAEQVPAEFWPTGLHLFLDRTGFDGWAAAGEPEVVLTALAIPFGLFVLVIALGYWRQGAGEAGREASARWLAGCIDANSGPWPRLWILLLAFPVWALLAWTTGDLGGDRDAYPVALWGALGTVLIALLMVARSGPVPDHERPAVGATGPAAPAPVPEDWPTALRRRGVELESLLDLRASPARPAPRRPGVAEFARRLERAGLGGSAPQIIEALAALLNPSPRDGLARILHAPDHCGQVEAVALGALLLDERLHLTTLVVCAGGAEPLAERLADATQALGREHAVTVVANRLDELRQASLWVVEANALSDVLLPMLKDDPVRLRRLGMIVWWQVHEFTGVLGANMWAVSRRLHRLVDARGREDVRVLACMRGTFQGDDQSSRFVQRLLPTRFDDRVQVPRTFAHALRIHLLTGHQRFFTEPANAARLPERARFPALVAALASVEAGWPTAITPPAEATGGEVADLHQALGSEQDGAARLVPVPDQALAWLVDLPDRDVLGLLEMVCCGGRRSADPRACHVALQAPANPYVAFLLTELDQAVAGRIGFNAARRLVGAEAHPAIIRRHLQLALYEMEDTGQGLLGLFLWSKEVVEGLLRELVQKDWVSRREVRYLDRSDRLRVEIQYRTNRIPDGDPRPLDTVGADLIEVRDPTAGGGDQGVRLRIDPERLTILAYPLRTFIHQGRRYRVREWTRPEEVLEAGWLPCEPDDKHVLTWRIRRPRIREITCCGPFVSFGRGQPGKAQLERVAVDATFQEVVLGVRRLVPDLTNSADSVGDVTWYAMPIEQRFRTRALVLRLPSCSARALRSLAQALRHVLPVHVGVEADALDVLSLTPEVIGEAEVSGVAIVDLFPGGIGLIDALEDDNALLLDLLFRARRWLSACRCASDDGCERCLRSLAALADNPDEAPRRRDALQLLERIV